MADEKKGAAVAEKPPRARHVIQAELDAARAKLAELRTRAEADHRKFLSSKESVDRAMNQWRKDRPDEPFDPDRFSPPMRPYVGDEKLHREHHRQHYVIEALEQELAASGVLS